MICDFLKFSAAVSQRPWNFHFFLDSSMANQCGTSYLPIQSANSHAYRRHKLPLPTWFFHQDGYLPNTVLASEVNMYMLYAACWSNGTFSVARCSILDAIASHTTKIVRLASMEYKGIVHRR